MEAFSLLKYWRGGGGGLGSSGGGGGVGIGSSANLRTTATIVTAVTHNAAETDDDDDDDGPFFDLEFAVQDEEEDGEERGKNGVENENDDVDSEDEEDDDDGNEEDEDEREFNFTISSNSSSSAASNNERTDPNLTLSPSDDLFFKGRLVPIESSSLVFNSTEPNSKPQFPVSLLKSATKFRVFMLGFKKMKQNNASEKTEANSVAATTASDSTTTVTTPPKQQQQPKQETEKTEKTEKEKEKQSKFFTVKYKVEEVPIVSLFTRDNSSSRKSQKQSVEDSTSDEKKFSKDVMQKYLKKVKPLYIRVSKRYGEKLKFSGQLSLGSVTKSVQSPPPTIGQKSNAPKSTAEKRESEVEQAAGVESQVKSQKQANIPERLRVACKHLGKSRSASSAVAAAPAAASVISRRDDSLLQQQDGIQSAILHCKRSFNASRDSESSMLPRSVSDPSHQKSAIELSRKSSDHEGKDESFEALNQKSGKTGSN